MIINLVLYKEIMAYTDILENIGFTKNILRRSRYWYKCELMKILHGE